MDIVLNVRLHHLVLAHRIFRLRDKDEWIALRQGSLGQIRFGKRDDNNFRLPSLELG